MNVSNTNEVEVEDAAAKRELEETSSDEDAKNVAVDKVPDDDEYSFDMEKYPVRELEVRFTGFKDPVSFNPVVSLIGVVCLWGLSIWCMVDPEGSNSQLQEWRSGVTLNFTWLFIGTRCAFLFFLIFVAYKWGHIKLGHKDEPPEFDTGSYFAMIFAAGVAVGLFVYGVAEPLSHRASHYYANSGYRSQDEIDMFAINMTVTNWGFGAWSVYLIVAVSMALAGFRFNLPMTFRSCFYPILGEYTWGWIGDCIDGFSIVVTVAGVCTSLGLGAIQIVAGFQFLGWVDSDASEDRLSNVQMLTIWGVTLIATASVVSGLQAGVKFLSQLAFGLGMLLTLIIFLMDNSKYILNLLVQECGYFIQYSVFHLNFLTDAFGQLREGEGRSVDGKAAHESWQDWWPIFYQAWWVSWACFVGLFIARISRGRTVFEVILYSMIAPIAYCILWFSVWGGIGLRQARQAEEMEVMGETYFGDKDEFKVPGSDVCFDVPQESLYNGTDTEPYFVNRLPGVTPVCKFGNALESGFNVLYSYSYPDDFESGYGSFLTVLFIFSLAIYFATSSDSGSLVVDHLASNGRKNHHWLQRVFWAFTEGAVATALLGSGGSDALAAVQAASIISGLPFVFFLVFIMQSITLMCKRADESDEMEYVKPVQPEFSVPVYGGIFNYGEYLCSLGSVNPKRIELGMDMPTNFHVVEFFKGVFLPFIPLQQVLQDTYPKNPTKNTMVTGLYATTYYAWIVLFIVQGSIPGVRVWAWVCFFIASFVLTIIRMSFRARFNIRSNIVGDFIAATIFWPQVFTQMRQHLVDYGNGSVIEGEVVEEDASGLKDVDA